ncbi:MAG: T9SS type A sorting domain-containing protein [Sphingobacteriaceae bacterium]|nr:T9SS type A sorting domain-containing protein [Sphingobacteriaceae bacterium]
MKKNYNYNELVRFYNRSRKKLSNLLALGKNEYKQDILKRRISRLFQLLTGMQTQLKLSTATFALTAGFILFQPNAANAQSFPTKLSNPFGLANTAGQWSTPTFVDLDNDGDKDVMAGDVNGDFFYYQNIGTASVPSFTASATNAYGLTNTGDGYACPSFVDLDNDGDKDMISSGYAGDIFYYQNTGSATAPAFAAMVTNPFGITTVTNGYGYGAFTDLDNDGDQDLMVGNFDGNFFYYQNTGTASAPAFAAPVMNTFGLTANLTAGYGTVAFTDLDSDGDKDMWSGDSGAFAYYLNTGTASAPAFGAPTSNPFSLTNLTNAGASPVFADLDNDGDQDMLTGISTGALFYAENTFGTGISTANIIAGVSIYPNPTTDNVTLKLDNTSEIMSVEVINALGQSSFYKRNQ